MPEELNVALPVSTVISPEPVFAADFTRLIGKRSFYSGEELEEWTKKARGAFEWLSRVSRGNGTIDPVVDHNWVPYDRLLSVASAFVSVLKGSDEAAIQTARSNLDATIAKYFRKRLLIPPEDPRVLFLQDLATKDLQIAVYALGYFTKTVGGETWALQIHGCFQALMFEAGIGKDSIAPIRGSLEKLHTEAVTRQSILARELKAAGDELTEIKRAHTTTAKTHAEDFKSAQAERGKQFSDAIDNSKKILSAFEQAYSQELATHSAVAYWGKKARVHRWLALATTVVAVVAGGGYLAYLAPAAFEKLLPLLSEKETPQWRIGLAIALALLGVWMLRILVRMFLSQMHLAADSSHRRVTILSYIALLKDPAQPLTKEDRSIVLSTVFRPISAGIIRDDAMPPSPWELLTRPPKG